MSRNLAKMAIKCTVTSCPCDCFSSVPGSSSIRQCDTCRHGWVAHALDKLGSTHPLQQEIVQADIVFEVASLILYGTQATPVRLKILLDRLFSVLEHAEVLQVLHGFGWSYEDYARGYILQDAAGRVISMWTIASRDEELIILQQFTRFAETKAIAHEFLVQETRERQEQAVRSCFPRESEIKKFIERSAVNFLGQSFRLMSDPTRFLKPPFRPPLGPGLPAFSPLSRLQQTMQAHDVKQENTKSDAVSFGTKTSPANSETSSPGPASPTQQELPLNALVSIGAAPVTSVPSLPMFFSPSSHGVAAAAAFGSRAMDLSKPSPVPELKPPAVAALPPNTGKSQSNRSVHNSTSNNNNNNNSSSNNRSGTTLTPPRRPWPGNLSSALISPTTGKKRVLCPECNKTFCDKGALKIHHSAVHLREMHCCTMPGCTMMFSSRRSRNRHSANPNPKLHTMSSVQRRNYYRNDTPRMAQPETLSIEFSSSDKLSEGSLGDSMSNLDAADQPTTENIYLDHGGEARASKRKRLNPTKLHVSQPMEFGMKFDGFPSSVSDEVGVNGDGDDQEANGGMPMDLSISKHSEEDSSEPIRYELKQRFPDFGESVSVHSSEPEELVSTGSAVSPSSPGCKRSRSISDSALEVDVSTEKQNGTENSRDNVKTSPDSGLSDDCCEKKVPPETVQ